MSNQQKDKQESVNLKEILVFQPICNVSMEEMDAIREHIKGQLADDPRFIVVAPHISVHYMQPGDSSLTKGAT